MSGLHRSQRYLFWLAMGTVTMALAMAVLLGVELAQKRVLEVSLGMRKDSITAPAFECEREFLRFRHVLDRAVNGRNPPDADALNLQYDLVLSRLTLLRDSPSISVLVVRPEYQTLMPKLALWARHADRVMGRVPHQRAELAVLLEETNALGSDVHALVRAADSEVSQLLEVEARSLLVQTNEIVVLTSAQLLLLLLAAGALVLRHRRQEQERLVLQAVTEDLRHANLRAQTAMENLQSSQEALARSETKAALSTVIASVSHELSTPLGNSLMTAGTLLDQGRDFRRLLDANQLRRSELSAFVERVSEGNDLMLRNLQRAVALLKNFRQVANDQASEQRRAFDLATVVQEVLDTMAPSLKRQPHQRVVVIPPGIVMDSLPGALGQIVINLVNNAYLHAFEGRALGLLTIRASLNAAGDRVQLVFADNGVGMSEEVQERLFQPFFSTKAGQGGTGLGMMIVGDLVRKTLGGSLEVSSCAGVGTTFRMDFPLVAPLSNG
jgi:signal transduction histidine kinase